MNGESVRTRSFRYTRWREENGTVSAEMLFDLSQDPHERNNLAPRAEMTEISNAHARLLDEYWPANDWSPALQAYVRRWRSL